MPIEINYNESHENSTLNNINKLTNTPNIIVRNLTENDRTYVENLDEESGNYVAQWLDDNIDYAWGAFRGNTLIGYCTTGYADDCCDSIENHPQHSNNSILLSDVYILPEYRHKGYATEMIKAALELRHQNDGNPNETVFLTVLHDDLANLYAPLGFTFIDKNGNMIQNNQ